MLIVYKKPTRGRFFVVGKPGSGPVPVPQPDDELWYTTSDGNPVDLSGASFNANVASHTYTGGKGVIKFDANLTEIGANSFENADIVTVSFPDTLTTIGDSAFDSCPITELDLKNVQSLGMEAFDYNYVSALHIPASVNYMNYNPFRTPYGNQTITVDENNTTFSDGGGCNCVYNETTNTLVVGGPNSTVPTGCTTIGEFAFSNCYSLTSIEFPASVTDIGWLAFGSDEQGNLATIRAHSVPTFGSNAFMSVADNGTLYLDAGLDPTDWMNELPAGWSLVQPCSVSITADPNGLISVDGGTPTSSYSGTVNYGTQITIQAIPDTDYEFDIWSDGDNSNPRYITVDGDITLSASFQVPPVVEWNVSVYSNGDGSVSVDGVQGDFSDMVADGTVLTLEATADQGYEFDSWSDGDNSNPRYITVDGDITLSASFQVIVQQDDELWYTSSGGNVVTPNDPTAFGGATIQSNTYSGGLGIIKFDQTLTDIGLEAFRNCSGLTSVTFGSGVTTIGEGAFRQCTGLTTIVIPDNVTTLAKMCFFGCSNATSLTVGSGVSSIANEAFSFTSRLSTITVDANNTTYDSRNSCNAIIETASNKLMAGCKDTVMPSSVTSTHYCAFSGCSNMQSITIGSGMAAFGNYTFYKCTSLASITFSSTTTVPTVGTGVFNDVASTGTVYGQAGLDYSTIMAALPAGWTLVQPQSNNEIWYTSTDSNTVIPNMNGIKGQGGASVTLVSNAYTNGKGVMKFSADVVQLTSSGYSSAAFYNRTTLASVSLPDSITTITTSAFNTCTSLASVKMPASLITIGTGSFGNCGSLTAVSIPASVTSIGSSAFQRCSSLTSITFESTTTVPTVNSQAFSQISSTGTVYGQPGLDYSAVMATLPSGWTLVQ